MSTDKQKERPPALGVAVGSAFTPEIVDTHALDKCICGGVLDHCKTTREQGGFYSTWTCRKCGDHSDQIEDEHGLPI